MCHQDSGLGLDRVDLGSNQLRTYLSSEHSVWADYFVKDVFPNMRVHGTERVVQEVDIGFLVHCTGQTHSLLLTTAQIDAL